MTFRKKSSSAVRIIMPSFPVVQTCALKFGVFSNTINRLHTILSSSLNPIIGLGSQQISALHYTCYSWSTEYLGSRDSILFFLQFDIKLVVFNDSRFPRHRQNQIDIGQNGHSVYKVRKVIVKCIIAFRLFSGITL